MDIRVIFENFGELLQVFVPARAVPFVPVILILVWVTYRLVPKLKGVAPLLALVWGLAVAFLFLQMPWREAIPTGLTLGGYAVSAWELGKIKGLERKEEKPQKITLR